MRKGLTGLLIILLLELVYAENIFSQIVTDEINLQTIYPGLIISLENDTISGYIMLTNLMKNQKKVEFYNSPDDPEPAMKYKPKEIKAYMVGARFYESFKFQPQGETEAYYFFHRVKDGPIKDFKKGSWVYL